jgi:predicted DNA-binding transcriptional regulator YafY
MQRFLKRILVGQASERTKLSLGAVDDSLLSVFERSFTGGLSMSFDYVDRFGAATSRRIECIALVLHAPLWYIVAWDLDKDAPRTFRMDRISAPVCGDALQVEHPFAMVTEQACPEAEAAYGGWIGTPIG